MSPVKLKIDRQKTIYSLHICDIQLFQYVYGIVYCINIE
jgi:hypothetical protein